jgi:pyrroline-5-carboxylate reductase
MFEIEEQAAKVESPETDVSSEQPTSPVETVDQTKAFAQRLKQEKAKAKEEARKEIAESFGYNSWQEYVDAQTNDKIIGKGMDPDAVKDVLKDLIYTNPDYVEAMKYKQEKEELEKEIFASNSIKKLNETYGTNYKSINELDKETVDMWNKGMTLEKAYAANNIQSLIDLAVKKTVATRDSGKSHLTNVNGSSEEVKVRQVSQEELRVAKALGLNEDKFKEYVKKQ